jgi:DNA-binding transcriptional MerR regulator
MAFLKIGELAKTSGVTVRALHHYDAIGLLVPSVRSDAGYRLYDPANTARLQAIVAMQALGLALDEVASLIESDGAAMHGVVMRRIEQVDAEIR